VFKGAATGSQTLLQGALLLAAKVASSGVLQHSCCSTQPYQCHPLNLATSIMAQTGVTSNAGILFYLS